MIYECTIYRKGGSLVSLQESIRKLMEHFNAKFDSVARDKERELQNLQKRRSRLREIAEELNHFGVCLELNPNDMIVPKWSPAEKPEKLLNVSNDQVL